MIETHAPGKLYVAGEYAVVEPGEPALLVSVDRFISVRLASPANPVGRVVSHVYGDSPRLWSLAPGACDITLEGGPYDYALSAISVVQRLAAERGRPLSVFDLEISSGLDSDDGRKYGLGSSGAVTVAVIEAAARYAGLDLDERDRFRLAVLAAIEVSPRSSCGDLAASTYGGWVRYTSPDRAALIEVLAAEGVSAALESDAWDPCAVLRIPEPRSVDLLVGWTGAPSSTDSMVSAVAYSADPTQDRRSFLASSRSTVDALTLALRTDDTPAALAGIRSARELLQRLSAATGTVIETETLAGLCSIAETHGAAAKSSGAGGGDCGIAMLPRERASERGAILEEWEAHGIEPLPLVVHAAKGGSSGE